MDAREHWEGVYREADLARVSWHQNTPNPSLSLVVEAGDVDARVLDVGAGTATLVDSLLDVGFRHLGVLDVSPTAIELTRTRLGDRAHEVEWFVSNVTAFESPHLWDVWHDRAVLHFLTDEDDRAMYRQRMEAAVARAGAVVLGTFGPEGPQNCSGLAVQRYGVAEMVDWIGPAFSLLHHELVGHQTPQGGVQQFLYCLFRRTDSSP